MGTGLTSGFRLDAWSCRPVLCCSGQVTLACGGALLLFRWCHSSTLRMTAACCRRRRSASAPSTKLISRTTSVLLRSSCRWVRWAEMGVPAGRGWVEEVEPYAGKDWTDTRRNRDRRAQLKQRAVGEGRPVPCPPELTRMLHEHIRLFGTAADGRLFVGERNGEELPNLTIVRAWQRARTAVFTEEVIASPLAATPYDLRHAAVSTWLNGGVPAVTVADWAGHSVEVLAAITRSGH
jgi:hypothetical protein